MVAADETYALRGRMRLIAETPDEDIDDVEGPGRARPAGGVATDRQRRPDMTDDDMAYDRETAVARLSYRLRDCYPLLPTPP